MNASESVSDVRLLAAIEVVRAAGLDVVLAGKYERLVAWTVENGGPPPTDWTPRYTKFPENS